MAACQALLALAHAAEAAEAAAEAAARAAAAVAHTESLTSAPDGDDPAGGVPSPASAAAAPHTPRVGATAGTSDAQRRAALAPLAKALPLLPAAAAPGAARAALAAASRLRGPRARRAACAAPLAAACLALASRPDLQRFAGEAGVLRALLGDALGALFISNRPFLEELLASVLLAAAGDAPRCGDVGSPPWAAAALEAAELGAGALRMDFSAHPGGRRPALVAAAWVALLARAAPAAVAAGGDVAARAQRALRGLAAATKALPAPQLQARALTLVCALRFLIITGSLTQSQQIAHHLEITADDLPPLVDAARQLLSASPDGGDAGDAAAAAALQSGSLRGAASASAQLAAAQRAHQAVVDRTLEALTVLAARCPPALRREAAPLLRSALDPLDPSRATSSSVGGAAAASAAAAGPALAALSALLSRADGTIPPHDSSSATSSPDDDAFVAVAPPAWAPPPAPPAAFAPLAPGEGTSRADAALGAAILAALAAAGVASGVGAGDAPAPPATPPRPHGAAVLVTGAAQSCIPFTIINSAEACCCAGPSDPYQVRISHDVAPAARRVNFWCALRFNPLTSVSLLTRFLRHSGCMCAPRAPRPRPAACAWRCVWACRASWSRGAARPRSLRPLFRSSRRLQQQPRHPAPRLRPARRRPGAAPSRRRRRRSDLPQCTRAWRLQMLQRRPERRTPRSAASPTACHSRCVACHALDTLSMLDSDSLEFRISWLRSR